MANVTELPTQTAPESDPASDKKPPDPRRTGRTKRGKPPQRAPNLNQPQFFDRVAAVPKEDWGTRAFMYVYVNEPACNPKTFGETRYLLKSSVPILDLEGLKVDYGSFKGWMSLNIRPTGKDQATEEDRFDFEIYDPKYPPKIPRAAWANDPRNKRWSDLLPPEPPSASAAASSLIDGIKVYKEIRNEVRDEFEPSESQPPNRTKETLETMKLAKELFGPAATTAAPESPLKIAVELANTMMTMKADNPVIDMYRDELKAMREELKEARAELRKVQTAPPAAPKTITEQLVEFASAVDKLGPLKTLLGGGNGTGAVTEGGTRIVRMNELEFWSKVIPQVVESPIASAIASKIMSSSQAPPMQAFNGNGAAHPAPPPQPQPQPAADPFQHFITDVATPAMLEYFLNESTGEALADWIYSVFPRECVRLQQFTHPMIPGLKGAPAIIQGYKNTPQVWPKIASKEAEFVTFINEFCTWKPEPDEEAIEVDGHAASDDDGWTNSSEREERTV